MNKADDNSVIDAVIAWVDGSAEEQKKKLAFYIKEEGVSRSPNVIPSRFDASDEIKYCILSIFRNAPFIRKVFIVTDGQRPDMEDVISKYFPERLKDINYIDHRDIFKGHEDRLPIFNSRAIETMLWRIPNISESFLYLNDDFFLVKPLTIEDFIKDKKLILRGKWSPAPLLRILWHEVITPKRKRRASYHLGQWNGAKASGAKFKYFVFEHTPYLVSKTDLERYFAENPNKLESNISYRFRNPEQFNPCSLSYHLTFSEGKGIQKRDAQLSYLQPYKRDEEYITRKTKECELNQSIKFMCVQDLSIASLAQRNEIYNWLDKTLQLRSSK